MFEMKIDTSDAIAKISTFGRSMRAAVAGVQPVFGAFMPYSYYAEYGNSHFGPQPSIEPAISSNAQWIVDEFWRRMQGGLQSAVDSGDESIAVQEAHATWDEILNGRVARHAKALARVRTGAHRASIAGYTQEAEVEAAITEGERQAAMQRSKKYQIWR